MNRDPLQQPHFAAGPDCQVCFSVVREFRFSSVFHDSQVEIP